MENVLQENDRLLTQALSVEIVNIVVHDNVTSDCLNVDVYAHCVTIESELKKDFIKKECYEMLLQQYHTLENHCISLEVHNQLKKEIFQKNTLSSSESAPTFAEFFEINKLKAQAQAKDTVILQLKEKLRSLKRDVTERNVKREVEEIETQNIELDHKVDVAPLVPKLRKNRTAHIDYIRHTQDEAATLREIVESCPNRPLVLGLRLLKAYDRSRSQLINFVQKFLGTVKFGNDHASKTKSWLWHRRLSHLNFGAINHLARQGLVRGHLKLKFEKDHLCSACAMGKSTKKTHKPKSEDTNQEKLYLLHMDLCGPMRVESVNGKKGCGNRMFYTKLIHYSPSTWKTPYELLHSKLPDLSFFHVFGALCYPTNDSENLRKLQPKDGIEIFIGYAPTKKAFHIYNRHTRRIVETIHVDFDELTAMASEQSSLGPALNDMTPGTITPEVFAPIAEVIPQVDADSTGSPSSTTVDQDAPSPSKSLTTTEIQSLVIPQDVGDDNLDMEVAHMGNDLLLGVSILEVTYEKSSSTASPQSIVQPNHQMTHHN
nr:integrase, catalytic region, zinc finger, CCHC-type, peptidase aspartic, catalytic [Tanacetum cinerariifolium]